MMPVLVTRSTFDILYNHFTPLNSLNSPFYVHLSASWNTDLTQISSWWKWYSTGPFLLNPIKLSSSRIITTSLPRVWTKGYSHHLPLGMHTPGSQISASNSLIKCRQRSRIALFVRGKGERRFSFPHADMYPRRIVQIIEWSTMHMALLPTTQ